MHSLGVPCAAVEHRVSGSILCPLGQPKKAVGLESQIGSWLALKPTLACVSFGTEWRRAPPFYETVELGQALGLASPLESAASQSGQTNNPSEHEVGLDASHHTRVFSRGGEKFLS